MSNKQWKNRVTYLVEYLTKLIVEHSLDATLTENIQDSFLRNSGIVVDDDQLMEFGSVVRDSSKLGLLVRFNWTGSYRWWSLSSWLFHGPICYEIGPKFSLDCFRQSKVLFSILPKTDEIRFDFLAKKNVVVCIKEFIKNPLDTLSWASIFVGIVNFSCIKSFKAFFKTPRENFAEPQDLFVAGERKFAASFLKFSK